MDNAPNVANGTNQSPPKAALASEPAILDTKPAKAPQGIRADESAQPPSTPSTLGTVPSSGGGTAPSKHPFWIGVADCDGKEIGPDADGFSDPTVKEARNLVFHLHPSGTEPTTTEVQAYSEIGKLEHAINHLYPASEPSNERKFRPVFVRLFYLAQLALEGAVTKDSNRKKLVGNRLSTDGVQAEIRTISEDLINDEAPRIKNGHLLDLAHWAGKFSVVFLLCYAVLMHFASSKDASFVTYLDRLNIDVRVAASFMLLWVGVLGGVCLSYAVRSHELSVMDLIRVDEDHLLPQIRLLLTGVFATLLTLTALIGLGDLAIGGYKLSNIDSNPMLAIVVGAIFGISEQKLSKTVVKRVENIVGDASKSPATK